MELGLDELHAWSTPDASARIVEAVSSAGYEEVEIDPRGFRSGALNQLAQITRA